MQVVSCAALTSHGRELTAAAPVEPLARALSLSLSLSLPMEATANKYLKKWYGLNHSAKPSLLYLPLSPHCGLDLTSITTLVKSLQVVGQHILKHSRDALTRSVARLYRNKAQTAKSKRWNPGAAVDHFEETLNFSIKFGGQTGRQGLGFNSKKPSRHSSQKERRDAIVDLCKSESLDNKLVELHGLVRSGNMLKWDDLMATQFDWNSQIQHMSKHELSFVLNAQALSAPSPSNLRRWGLNQNASCKLCSKPAATGKHILSGCRVALNQNRYTWRHNNILLCIQRDLCGRISQANRNPARAQAIPPISSSFVKSGKKKSAKSISPKRSLLCGASDWSMVIDLDSTIAFPISDVPTSVRPDIVIFSKLTKTVIWGELTSPNEKRIPESAILKKERYEFLKLNLVLLGWKVHDLTFEVGSIGFLGQSVRNFLSKLGFPKHHLNSMLSRIATAARRSSFYIWNARRSISWSPINLFPPSPSISFPSPQVDQKPPTNKLPNATPTTSLPNRILPSQPCNFTIMEQKSPSKVKHPSSSVADFPSSPHQHVTHELFDIDEELAIEDSLYSNSPPPSPSFTPHRHPWNIV